MSFSQETIRKIEQFAREQSQYYLEDAEMTYMEKLRRKSGQARAKIGRKMARLKNRSEQADEAECDMILYMSDYIEDLAAKGMSEREAFDKASVELAASSESSGQADLRRKFKRYCANNSPADDEVAGLLYGGFAIISMAVGALVGFLSGGGRTAFLRGGWIDTLTGLGAGVILGAGLGLLANAVLAEIRKR